MDSKTYLYSKDATTIVAPIGEILSKTIE